MQEVEASELKMRLDEALSVHRQAAARENEQEGYWQVLWYRNRLLAGIRVSQ